MCDENNSCLIQRVGTLIENDGIHALIEVEGKAIRIPGNKVSAAVLIGQTVRWSDGLWRE